MTKMAVAPDKLYQSGMMKKQPRARAGRISPVASPATFFSRLKSTKHLRKSTQQVGKRLPSIQRPKTVALPAIWPPFV